MFQWIQILSYLAGLGLGGYVLFVALIGGQSNRLVDDNLAVGLAFAGIAVASFMLGRILLRRADRKLKSLRRKKRRSGQLRGPLGF